MTADSMHKVLSAREHRASLKKQISGFRKPSVSLTLNIPGFPKTDETIRAFFDLVLSEFILYLKAHLIEASHQHHQTDEAGDFFIASAESHPPAHDIKRICEMFEEAHHLGRFIDADVCDESGMVVSSEKNKMCFYCGTVPAIDCMRNHRHSYDELRRFQHQKISEYLSTDKKTKTCRRLASAALRAILHEISLTPKPGLVDFNGTGSHTDMDYFTFIDSTSALAPYFQQMAESGYDFVNDLKSGLPRIRNIGLQMEQDMFGITKGVNTQKGIIFLMGVALFASAHVLARDGIFALDKFMDTVKSIGTDLLNELDHASPAPTHGKLCAEKYGKEIAGGARLEVASGFHTAITRGLPFLEKLNDNTSDFTGKQKILSDALLSLIAHNNDTNVLYRSGIGVLSEMKRLSRIALESETEKDKSEHLECLFAYCKDNHISPGGSADLLAVAVFLCFTEREVHAV